MLARDERSWASLAAKVVSDGCIRQRGETLTANAPRVRQRLCRDMRAVRAAGPLMRNYPSRFSCCGGLLPRHADSEPGSATARMDHAGIPRQVTGRQPRGRLISEVGPSALSYGTAPSERDGRASCRAHQLQTTSPFCASAHGVDAGVSVERDRERQEKLGVAAAASRAAHYDGGRISPTPNFRRPFQGRPPFQAPGGCPKRDLSCRMSRLRIYLRVRP
jgi:hypothetical protein